MSKKAVEKLFDSLYLLTDLRQIFRETSPNHELKKEQVEEVKKIVKEVRENLDEIEEEMSE
ncbi:hypothetical protein AKJ65_02940 [candidate division MSBL1 archaeon SCGC-AAA259E19]|uniref:Uncharacterized protein n=1 Tax=candidate division MSBL1 archaeon SCGC-AAA259E19 TaxID=1698264 RepID=A0A133ULB0_9EURY|nr:hypothetical protein AKJ65_02940 [candidate division MSBL1 archaeon SCGC-AAA259E19]